MVDFEAGAGFAVNGNQVHVNFDKQPDEVVEEAFAELQAVRERRGLADEAAGIAVAHSDLVTPELLVATVGESGAWYTNVGSQI